MKGKRGKTQKTSIYSQYGYESSGQANLISQASAIERKAKLKNQLEVNFRAMIKKYLDKDARTMIAEHEQILAKQNGSPNKNSPSKKKESKHEGQTEEIEK